MNKNIIIKKIFKIISIILVVFLFGWYILPKESIRPPKNVPDEIFELNQEILNIINSPNSTIISDGDYWINDLYRKNFWNKNSLNSIEKLMLNTSRKFNIKIIYISKKYKSISYHFGAAYNAPFIDKPWSYVYRPNDYTEETRVPSIDKAIERLKDKSIYHFSEPTDKKHWFICISYD